MVYVVTYKKAGVTYTVFDPRLADNISTDASGNVTGLSKYGIYNTRLELGVNKVGSFEFTVPSQNSAAGVLAAMEGSIAITSYGGSGSSTVFLGRIVKLTRNFINDLIVKCEGALACLNDTSIAEYNTNGTASSRLSTLLGLRYNIGSPFTVSVGTCTVSGSAAYSGNFGTNLWQCINRDLLDQFGGYVVPRYSGDSTVYVDYLAAITDLSGQDIRFAVNLLDLEDTLDGSGLVNLYIPRGKDGLGIMSVSDGWYNASGQQTSEGAQDAIYYKTGRYIVNVADRDRHGCLSLAYEDKNIETVSDLFSDVIARLNATSGVFPRTISVKAADLSFIGDSQDDFEIGKLVRVTSLPHGISANMPITAITMDLLDPVNAKITIGDLRATASGIISRTASSSTTTSGSGGGGVTVHGQLTGRDLADQHPMSAITGLVSALESKADSGDIPTKTSDLTNDSGFLTSQDISGKENLSNKVTALSSASTDTQYPSAKCVYDELSNKETVGSGFEARANGAVVASGKAASDSTSRGVMLVKNTSGKDAVKMYGLTANNGEIDVLYNGNTRAALYTAASGKGILKLCSDDGSSSIVLSESTPIVIDGGTSDVWTWRKWSDGTAECWAVVSINTSISSAWGSLYESSNGCRVSYPSGLFTAAPCLSVSVSGNSGAMLESYGAGSASTTPEYYLVRPSRLSASDTFYFSIHAIGR